MNNVCKNLARMIDLSAVQAQNTKEDILACAEVAKKYNIISIHVLPNWTSFLREQIKDYPEILIGGPVGFPSGGVATSTKVAEIHQLIADGASEVDMVVNVGRVLSGDFDYVRKELEAAVHAAHPVEAKTILETHYLNEEQIRKVCDIAVESGMAWIKTATGWTPSGATVENISIIADQLDGKIGIKASGGIRSLELIKELYSLGVRRFGLSIGTTKTVLEQLEAQPELFSELDF
ncbi:deoxyribose-phosphate aldolase [Vibrio hannami]|uniref:deoxyribose-phosphate aldolase n=1 Tax=Vibrio hannami TaxID=2717094 RepID=UPI00240F5233|nr:deoxyribose-phosphate aldolase [Vibrio hannami]MDG3085348.1 deoxyribose-phosphate aldolase [Vibrio hannami]